MAVVIIDHAKAVVGLGIGDRPEAIIGWRAVDEVAHRALGLEPFRVGRMLPKAHHLGIGEAGMHRIRILSAELAKPQAACREDRVRDGKLGHIGREGCEDPLRCRSSPKLPRSAPLRQAGATW